MIKLIVAMDDEGGIGLNNDLPWSRIPEDRKQFRDITLHKAIIMGRKTFDNLGKSLPKRMSLVLTNAKVWTCKNSLGYNSIEALSEEWKDKGDLYVVGGAQIYDLFLPYAWELLITRIPGIHSVDTWWKPDMSNWHLLRAEPVYSDLELVCTFERWVNRSQPKELP